jgi:hypothetical protein
MFKRLAAALLLRKVVAELASLKAAVEAQNVLLARLVDHFAPHPEELNRAQVREATGVDFLDPVEAGLAQDFAEKTFHQTGHLPDEDELLIYLADEKTTDLHKRLIQRAQELERLQESRLV